MWCVVCGVTADEDEGLFIVWSANFARNSQKLGSDWPMGSADVKLTAHVLELTVAAFAATSQATA